MTLLVLIVVLILVLGGCACVVWANRGGPRWVRAVAVVTLAAGELVRVSDRNRRRGSNQTADGGE